MRKLVNPALMMVVHLEGATASPSDPPSGPPREERESPRPAEVPSLALGEQE